MVFHRRSGDIIEIQEGLPTDIEADACSPGYMNQEQLPFTSLLRTYENLSAKLHVNLLTWLLAVTAGMPGNARMIFRL